MDKASTKYLMSKAFNQLVVYIFERQSHVFDSIHIADFTSIHEFRSEDSLIEV